MQRPEAQDELAWTPERARSFGQALFEVWVSYLEALPSLPVSRDQSPAEVRDAVTRPVPAAPLPDAEIVEYLEGLLLEHSIQPGHGGFMAYITGAGTVPGGPAALLAAAVNQNLGGWVLSPGATEIETHLLSWFAGRLGLPETSSGAFVAGGATANFMALAAARDALTGWDIRRDGVAGGPPLGVYVSDDAHETVDRAADLLGLGSAAVRRVATDGQLRVRPDALEDTLAADLAAGVRPICIVGTAGTTEFGAIDPLGALADLATRHGCWFHVDAAYGGPAAMVDALRPKFAGIDRADSLTCDPHKWMNTPLTSSLVLFRNPAKQWEAFNLETDYTRYATRGVDDMLLRYQWTPQFSRPFDALPVWVSLLAHGWDAYARRITHDIELARWLYHLVGEVEDLEPAIAPELSIVGFRYVPPDLRGRSGVDGYLDRLNEHIVYALQQQGRVFPSNAVIDGRFVIRACLIGLRTEAGDVEALVEQTVTLGRRLHRDGIPGA